MKRKTELSDAELHQAAMECMDYDLAWFDLYADFKDPVYSEQFTERMDTMLVQQRKGQIKAAEYFMGWQYYTKRGIAAVLLCFLLACVTMPEAVLAGYHKLIEVVETIFEEYTEYRYTVNEDGAIEEVFRPIQLNYLPNNLMEDNKRITNSSLKLVYCNVNKQYFIIYQKLMTEQNMVTYLVDVENTKTLQIKGTEAKFKIKDEAIYFMWLNERYFINGQTNLTEEELVKILEKSDI